MSRKTKSHGLLSKIAFTGLMTLFSLLLAIVAGEIFLRIVYRDAGTTTMKGPGGKEFIHKYPHGDRKHRGPTAKGTKKNGVERILIQGDSITFGWGVKEWEDLYTHRLLKMVNHDHERFDIFTEAYSGREMDDHLKILENVIDDVDPDLIVYQWYINDLEIIKNRKRSVNQNLFWRAYPLHEKLRKLSYLYFFLDSRLAIFVPNSDITYEDIMLDRFQENSHEWARFRILFHNWALIATSQAKRTIIMLYPHPPITLNSPIKSLYKRMKKISGSSTLCLPGYISTKNVGHDLDEANSYYGKIRKAFAHENQRGSLAAWGNIYLKKGSYKMTFRLKSSNTADKPIALIKIKSHGKVIAIKNISGSAFTRPNEWINFTIPFDVAARLDKSVEFDIQYLGGADLSFERAQLPIDYGIEVLDLTESLAGFNSYVSLFDAHPNAIAHKVMAEELYKQILGRDPRT